jgi:LemA protein
MTPTEKTGTGCLGATMIIVPLIIIFLVFGLWGYFAYNKMVSREEATNGQWAKVESAYQRRADLILNLVNTVKGYASHENKTLVEVTEARSKVSNIKLDAENLSDADVQKFQQMQDGLSGSLSKLMVVCEQYPDLKANQNFMDLQNQLKETENLILVERNAFNDVAQKYNVLIRKFPNNIFASIFGFKKKGYFQAKPGADEAPKVQF